MGRRLGYVAVALLGALLFGTAGLALGSWYGGTLLGVAAGAALFWVVARSRWPVPLVVGTLVTVALFPGAVFTWTDLAVHRLAEPVWPVWRGLAPVLVPLWLVLLLIGVIVLARRRDPAVPVTDPVAGRPRTPDQPDPVQRDLGAVTEA